LLGGVIAFDEYREDTWQGATKAIDEFFADKKEKLTRSRYLPSKHYVVKQ
jgi:hypothetical protein